MRPLRALQTNVELEENMIRSRFVTVVTGFAVAVATVTATFAGVISPDAAFAHAKHATLQVGTVSLSACAGGLPGWCGSIAVPLSWQAPVSSGVPNISVGFEWLPQPQPQPQRQRQRPAQ